MSVAISHSFVSTAIIASSSMSFKRRPAFCTRRPTASPSTSPELRVPLDVDCEFDCNSSDSYSVYSASSTSSSDCEADDESMPHHADYRHRNNDLPFMQSSSPAYACQSSIPLSPFPFDPSPSRGRSLTPKPLRTYQMFEASHSEPKAAPSILSGSQLGISLRAYYNLILPSPRYCDLDTPRWMTRSTTVTRIPPRTVTPKYSSHRGKVGRKDSSLWRYFLAHLALA